MIPLRPSLKKRRRQFQKAQILCQSLLQNKLQIKSSVLMCKRYKDNLQIKLINKKNKRQGWQSRFREQEDQNPIQQNNKSSKQET
jgi:hypothetical protein